MSTDGKRNTHELFEILGAAVTLGDCRIPVPQEGDDRVSDDVASADHDSVGTGDGDIGCLNETEDCCRSARSEERGRRARGKVANVICVESNRDERVTDGDEEGMNTHRHPFRERLIL